MKHLFLAFAFVFALAGQTAAPNVGGTWTLDKGKSQNLTSSLKQFERAVWMITQTDKEISIDEAFYGLNLPGSRPPAREGRGGGVEPIGARVYKLDGSETTKDIGRTKFVRKAILSSDGKSLELVEKMISPGTDGEVTRTTSDRLSLSDDGKVLTVIRRKEGSPGPPESTLVFLKEP